MFSVAGTAKEFDQNSIVHAIWKRLAELNVEMWVERVPTKENLADEPSRERYALLEYMGARSIEPVLDDVFLEAQTWRALSVIGLL